MLVAGPRGAGKSEFAKQLLSLKWFIMTNPPERVVCIEFYEGLPTNIEVIFDRSK